MVSFQAVQPVLPVRNVTQAISYYTERLGFTLAFQDSAENPCYAGVRRDQVELHLQWHDEKEWDQKVECPSLRFAILDIEDLYEEFKKQNVFHERTTLRETEWGTREFAFFDPDSNGLTFFCDVVA